jgi:hypothetical protein
MSAVAFDTELLSSQSLHDVDTAASDPSGQRPGLFTRIMDTIGRAYTVELPDRAVIFIYPPC